MATDKPYGITTIRSFVPLILDLDSLNYDAWRELFSTHCSKAFQRDSELRTITMGDSSVTRIKTLADLLENLDAKVPEMNLVMYIYGN